MKDAGHQFDALCIVKQKSDAFFMMSLVLWTDNVYAARGSTLEKPENLKVVCFDILGGHFTCVI